MQTNCSLLLLWGEVKSWCQFKLPLTFSSLTSNELNSALATQKKLLICQSENRFIGGSVPILYLGYVSALRFFINNL